MLNLREPVRHLVLVNGYLVDMTKQVFFPCDGILKIGYNVYNEVNEKIGSMEASTKLVYFGI